MSEDLSLKWGIEGVDYEYLTAQDFAGNRRDDFDDISEFTMEMAEQARNSREAGQDLAESDLVIDGDNVFDPYGGEPLDTGCVVARKEGRIIGVLKIDYGGKGGDGYMDKGVVSRDFRKENVESRPVSEILMRLSLSILVGKYGNERITGEPSSERGRKYVEANGFSPVPGGETGKYGKERYQLDPRIVEKMKEVLENQNIKNNELTPEQFLELKKAADLGIEGVITERQRELGSGISRV